MLSHGQRQLFSLARGHCRERGRVGGGTLGLDEFRNLPCRCLALCELREGEGACMTSLEFGGSTTDVASDRLEMATSFGRVCALDTGRILAPQRRAI